MTRFGLRAAVAGLLLVGALASCARPEEKEGAGGTVDLCDGWPDLRDLRQADFTDTGDLRRWLSAVERITGRIDVDADDEVDDEPIPADLPRRVERAERVAGELADQAGDATDPAQVEAAIVASTLPEDLDAISAAARPC